MVEVKPDSGVRVRRGFQLIKGGGDIPKPQLPTAPVRELIYELYVREERNELEIAANLKIPVASVRLVLRGYQEIARRWRATQPAWARATEAEIAAEVWGEFGGRPTGGGAAVGRRAA